MRANTDTADAVREAVRKVLNKWSAGEGLDEMTSAVLAALPEPVAKFEIKHRGPAVGTAEILNALVRGHYVVFPVEVPHG